MDLPRTDAVMPMRSFDRSLPMALLRARENVMWRFRAELAKHDFTEQQWRVLRALSSLEEPIEVGPLAEFTSLLAPSLSRILTRLEEREFIERQVAFHDQRRSLISLSASGREQVESVAPSSETIYREIEEKFGPERLERLLRELRDLADVSFEEEESAR